MSNYYDEFKYFHLINKHANLFIDNALSKYGLNSAYRIFIKIIVEEPGITRDQIKVRAHVHPSNTTRCIDYLSDNDFITKQEKENDKRICMLYPTDKLKEVYDLLISKIDEWENSLFEGISEEERNELSTKLKDLSIKAINKAHNQKD